MKREKITVGVVGTGVIGASWAACFLAHGYTVRATDPATGAEQRLQDRISQCIPALERMGVTQKNEIGELSFHANIESAVTDCEIVQENGPERLDIKRDTIQRITGASPAHALIATSSSGIPISKLQDVALYPERLVLGHPFNPPHLIPLVEVVGGRLTSQQTIDRAMSFYASLGKKPIHIKREVKGHVANRLQAALWREAIYLVEQGVVSVSDIDAALSHGPGLRWALLGAFANLHLSGGAGGIAHTLKHLGPPIEEWWADLGSVRLSPELNARIEEGLNAFLAETDEAQMVAERDEALIQLLELKARSAHLP